MIKKWLYKWLFSNFDLLEIELFFNIYFEIIFDVQKSCKNSIVHIYPYSFYPNVTNIHTQPYSTTVKTRKLTSINNYRSIDILYIYTIYTILFIPYYL